jgi:hypothetical protein
MRSVCEKVFKKSLREVPTRPGTFFQAGQTMVMIESRQWKLAYSPLEKVIFDATDEHALLLEVPGEHGTHIIPWHMVLRITITEGAHL